MRPARPPCRSDRPIDRRELNILFTCAGRRVALLRAFRQAMASLDISGRLLVTDVTPIAAAFQTADAGLLVPRTDEPAYPEHLLGLIRTHRVGLVVPTTDRDLPVLAEHRRRFEDSGCAVMVGPPEVIRLCRDKTRLPELLSRAALPAVRSVGLAEFRAGPFYPCFVKPRHGSAGIGARVIHNAEQLHAHTVSFGQDLLVQEYLQGQEFTIDAYRSRDGVVRCAVPRLRLRVRGGEVQRAVTIHDPMLIDAACRLAGCLAGLWGAFCCQCRVGADRLPRFFDINPRFGGGVPLTIAAGADIPLYLLQEVLQLPITAELGLFAEHLVMARYDDAVFRQVDDPSDLPGFDSPLFQ